MADLVIRPSMKKVWFIYLVCFLILVGAIAAYGWYQPVEAPFWVALLPMVLFLWPISQHIHRASTTLTLADGKLRYQTGLLSRSTRTMELSRLQDVRVDQTLGQRLLGLGSISLETAGETSRLTMESVDSPQQRADAILAMARGTVRNSGL